MMVEDGGLEPPTEACKATVFPTIPIPHYTSFNPMQTRAPLYFVYLLSVTGALCTLSYREMVDASGIEPALSRGVDPQPSHLALHPL